MSSATLHRLITTLFFFLHLARGEGGVDDAVWPCHEDVIDVEFFEVREWGAEGGLRALGRRRLISRLFPKLPHKVARGDASESDEYNQAEHTDHHRVVGDCEAEQEWRATSKRQPTSEKR
uniref:Secreted protein n=1 Tax=Vitrella brassicaformis TaxID=1169539 RepID=A0A7S1JK69_9ALVE